MKRRDPFAELLGISLADFGGDVWGGAHLAGKTILNAFGAGAVAQPLETLESPYLPAWAKTTQGPPPGATPMSAKVPPGAMPKKPPPTMKPPGKPSPSSAPTKAQPSSFLHKWKRPIEIGAGAAVALGAVALLAHFAAPKGKRK